MIISNEAERIKSEIFDIFELKYSIQLFEACMSIVNDYMEIWMNEGEYELNKRIEKADLPS